MYKAIKQYQDFNLEAEVMSASPYRITQMLFEGCLKFLNQAKVAIKNKDYVRKSEYIGKAEAIIITLAGTLKSEHNEELASNLSSLYQYCLDRLIEASLEMDVSKVEDAYSVMMTIKKGWDAIPQEQVSR